MLTVIFSTILPNSLHIQLPRLFKDFNVFLSPVIRKRIGQRLVGLAGIAERYLSVDALVEIDPVREVFGGCKDKFCRVEIAWVEVDSPAPLFI